MILDLGRSAVRGRHNVFAVLTGSVRRPSSSGSWTADVGGGGCGCGVEFATAELGQNGWANPPNPAIFIDFSNREAEDHRIWQVPIVFFGWYIILLFVFLALSTNFEASRRTQVKSIRTLD